MLFTPLATSFLAWAKSGEKATSDSRQATQTLMLDKS